MLCLSAVVLTLIGQIFARPILILFGASSDTLIYARPYLMIYVLGTLPSMLSTGLNPFINAQGYSTTGMLTVAIGAFTNLVLDPIFILRLPHGRPRSGACYNSVADAVRRLCASFSEDESRTEDPVPSLEGVDCRLELHQRDCQPGNRRVHHAGYKQPGVYLLQFRIVGDRR